MVDDSPDLDLREDSDGNPVICGVLSTPIQTMDEVVRLLKQGNRRRIQEATAANAASSRSHAILEVCVQVSGSVVDVLQVVRTGRLFMIDLAGSERYLFFVFWFFLHPGNIFF